MCALVAGDSAWLRHPSSPVKHEYVPPGLYPLCARGRVLGEKLLNCKINCRAAPWCSRYTLIISGCTRVHPYNLAVWDAVVCCAVVQTWVLDEGLQGGGEGYDVGGLVLAQLFDGAESPCHAYGVYTCSACRLHVYARVAYLEHVVLGGGAFAQNLKHDGRVRFYRHPLFLSLYRSPAYVGEKTVYERLHGTLVFV